VLESELTFELVVDTEDEREVTFVERVCRLLDNVNSELDKVVIFDEVILPEQVIDE